MTRDEIEGLLQVWARERSVPPASPDALAQVLTDALSEHWFETPEALRNAVLAVVSVLRTSV